MKATYWYHLKTPQCRISRDMKKMTRAVRSIREMMKNHIQAMDFFVNAWRRTTGIVQGGRVDDERAI